MKIPTTKITLQGFLSVAGFLSGVGALLVSYYAYDFGKQITNESRQLHEQEYLYEALDLLGFQPRATRLEMDFPIRGFGSEAIDHARLEQARRAISRLRVVNPESEDLDLLMMAYFLAKGDFNEVNAKLAEIESSGMADADLYLMAARIMMLWSGREKDSMSYFEKATSMPNPKPGHLMEFATYLHMRNNNERALEYIRKMHDLVPATPESIHIWGHILSESGYEAEAEKMLRDSIVRWPEYSDHYNTLGVILTLDGRFDEAIEMFRKAVELSPTNGLFRFNLSAAFRRAEQTEAADIAYSDAERMWNTPLKFPSKDDDPISEF